MMPRRAHPLVLLPAILMCLAHGAQAQPRSAATYRVTFRGTWTTAVTPGGIPRGAHFTTLIGGVHNAGVTFLREGGMATAGVEFMAELGGTSTLANEVRAAEPHALSVIRGSGNIGPTSSSTINTVTLTTDHPRVTLLSMVAPSPDWFVGVFGLSLLDSQGEWLPSRVVNLYPWDAGTEDGTEFSLSNPATSPQGVITNLRGKGKFSNERIATLAFTRQSVMPLPEAPEAFTLDFAHFANGEGITSEVVLLNVGGTPIRPTVYFFDPQGESIDAASVVELTDDLEVQEDTGGLMVRTATQPLGELTITTHGRGDLVSGSVQVVSEGPIGGVLRYRVPEVGVTGVGAGLAVRDALFPARRREGGIRTAAAMRNLGDEAMMVSCRLMSGGVVLEEAEIPLAGNGQTSWFIEEVFTSTDTTDFVGTVRCTAPEKGMFTGLAVEVDAANRIFTTLPVVAVEERMPEQ